MSEEDQVILQEMPPECWENARLRSGIPERLQRLQQAAHPRLANLLGIRDVAGKHFLAWQKTPGRPLDQITGGLSEDELYHALREMIDAAEALHQLGLVHGNLRPENIMVSDDGVYLTSASPLLWSDESLDAVAAGRIVQLVLQQRRLPGPKQELKSLRAAAAFLDGGYLPEFPGDNAKQIRVDARAVAWAIFLLLLALVLAVAIAWHFRPAPTNMLQSNLANSASAT